MSRSDSLQASHIYEFSVFRLDVGEGLFIGDEAIRLAPKVLQTLTYFVENPGRIISKDELFEKVWADTFVEDGALSFNISKLRKTLAEFDGETNFIETVSKRGFRFIAEVREMVPAKTSVEVLIERHSVREFIEEKPETSFQTGTGFFSKLPGAKTNTIIAAAFMLITILMFGAGAAFVWQRQANIELRSFDELHSEDLTSWRTSGSSNYSDYSSSHSGNLVAYSSTEDGVSEAIFVKQLNGGDDIRITNDGSSNFSPIWSPDDDQIAFVSVRKSESGIYFCPSLGGAPKLVEMIGEGELSLRSWSKDGSAIFYELDANLYRIDIATKKISPITNFPPSKSTRKYFAVSPEEDSIAYCSDLDGQIDIWKEPIAGGVPQRLTNDKDGEIRPAWHPDGKRIFYSVLRDNHYQISVAYTDGREPAQITRGDGKYELINISPDGTRMFYSKWQDRSDIWGVSTDGGAEFVVTSEPESEFWPEVSPDGKSVAFLVNTSAYVYPKIGRSIIVVRGVNDKRVLHSFTGYDQKWLKDGRNIAFMRWNENDSEFNLWLFDTVSGIERQLTTDSIVPPGTAVFPYNRTQTSNYAWSRDAGRYVFIDSTKLNVWMDSASGPNARNLTNNDDPNQKFFCPIWSPDEGRIAYVSKITAGERPLWRAWVLEGENRRVVFETSKSLRFLGWSAAGDNLFFQMADGAMTAGLLDVNILQVSLEGETRTITSLSGISTLSTVLSPGGDEIYFVSRSDGKDNIYAVSTANGDTRKITSNFDPDVRFGVLSWSPDGKTIYFDKQEELNIISVFQNLQ